MSAMRFADLNPRWCGDPAERCSLSFICPMCGPGYVIAIHIGPSADAATRTWRAIPMPSGADWMNHVTIEPSINNTTAGHGRKHPTCGFHGSIVNGQVVYPEPGQ